MKGILFLGAILVAVCNAAQAQTIVTGGISGLNNGAVVFNYEYQGKSYMDTVYATNSRFTYRVKKCDRGMISVRVQPSFPTGFWLESGTVQIEGHRLDSVFRITGTPENEVLTEFRESIERRYQRLRKSEPDSVIAYLDKSEHQETIQFIRQKANGLTGAYLLYGLLLHPMENLTTYGELYGRLSKKESWYGRKVAERLQVLAHQPVIGKPLPEFTLPDVAGRKVSLSDFRGSYVLLDFWGHWCAPCLKAFPRLRKLEEQYKVKIVGVAAEFREDKAKWLKAIVNANVHWTQVSELAGDGGKVNIRFNIVDFPAYFLVDANGVLIERSGTLDRIEKVLEAQFGK
ncbi:MAG: AhpC/TSA family protein [Siphonobacter aquaeclarae]|nr:AhpC/TSA family protein [Siphonobacter aquaeclarae]